MFASRLYRDTTATLIDTGHSVFTIDTTYRTPAQVAEMIAERLTEPPRSGTRQTATE